VEELAGLGVSVYTCARSAESLQSSLESWRQAGLQVHGSVCDLSVREAREALFRAVRGHFGDALDILVRATHTLPCPCHSLLTLLSTAKLSWLGDAGEQRGH
jgi:Tropinone reductase 1